MACLSIWMPLITMVCLHFVVLCNNFMEPPNEMIDYQSHHYWQFRCKSCLTFEEEVAWCYIVLAPPPPCAGRSVLQCAALGLSAAVQELEGRTSVDQARLHTLRKEQMMETLECLLQMDRGMPAPVRIPHPLTNSRPNSLRASRTKLS